MPLFVLLFPFVFLSFANAQNASKFPLSIVHKNSAPVCPGPVSKGFASCHARVVVDPAGKPPKITPPVGYGPLQFHTAYNLPVNATSGNPIIAIVDAYDNPNAYSDLSFYSSTFGISKLPQCTGSILASSVPCFQKIDQNGGVNYPIFNQGWALESSLDVQVSHAICQNCKILLVEANSSSYNDLLIAENQAVAQGATAVSNSWSSVEFSSETSVDSYFNHPGVAITAASGDAGYGPQYPAASNYVIAVGGTTLQINSDNSYFSETAWSGTGSGCSAYEAKPSFQTDTLCVARTINDISADADPSTGASVYDTSGYQGTTGWYQMGGTSLATPIIASIYAMAGVSNTVLPASVLYANSSKLHDVTSGSNGTCGNYLCSAQLGFDGPTGLGTPNGLNAFVGSVPTPTPTSTPTLTPTPTLTITPSPTITPTPTLTLTPTPTPKPHGHGH